MDNPLLGFPFAKLLRNFCGTKCKICLSLHMSLSRKNNNLRYHSKKSFCAKLPYSVFAKLKFCAILQLEFWAILKFCKNQTVGDGVCFLEFNSSSAGRFCTKIRNRLSSKSLDNFSFGHAYFLKADSSGIGYFLALFYMRLKRFQKEPVKSFVGMFRKMKISLYDN